MLVHAHAQPVPPTRVTVVGAAGFVGSHIVKRLTGVIPVQAIRSAEIDLLRDESVDLLAARLDPSDAVVLVSAMAPCRDAGGLRKNMVMVENLCAALAKQPVSHVINISSDAVYSDAVNPIRESSFAHPGSVHGAMHLARELALTSGLLKAPVAMVRPSLLFGADDPHNGYGPNRFRRLAIEGKPIVLFGEGEEQRDHVFVDDVAELVFRILMHRSRGILNAATGRSLSFRAVAQEIVAHCTRKVDILGTLRANPVTHRHFDISVCLEAFPTFRYTSFETACARVQAESTRQVQ